jgi:hypothetical protein
MTSTALLSILFLFSTFVSTWHDQIRETKAQQRQNFLTTLFNKEFENIHDLIKDEEYRAQRAAYRSGNCSEHPMDVFVKQLIKYDISLQQLGSLLFNIQETKCIAPFLDESECTLKNIQQLQNRMHSKILFLKEIAQSETKQIIIDDTAKELITKEIHAHIQDIYSKIYIDGKLVVYVTELDESRAAASNKYGNPTVNQLFLDPNFFDETAEIQHAILLHELAHLFYFHSFSEIVLSNLTGHSCDSIRNSDFGRYQEYVADQLPAFVNLENAKFVKRGRKQMKNDFYYYEELTTHPHNIDRYNAVKTIVQLHKTFARLAFGIPHPR